MKEQKYDKTELFWMAISVFVIVGGLIMLIFGKDLLAAQQPFSTTYTDLSAWINNIAAPVLALVGTLMLFINFRRQRLDANENNKELARQRFESDFLQLLLLHRENQKYIQELFPSDDFFHFYCNQLKYIYKNKGKKEEDFIKEYKENFYPNHYNKIDHYLQHIEYTFERILETEFLKTDAEARKKKVQMLCNQLTTDEIFMIFYHNFCTNRTKLNSFLTEGFFDRIFLGEAPHLLDKKHKDL